MSTKLFVGNGYLWKWTSGYTGYKCGAARKKRAAGNNVKRMTGGESKYPLIQMQGRGEFNPLLDMTWDWGTGNHFATEVGDFRLMLASVPCDPGWLDVTTVADCQQAAHFLQLDYAGAKVCSEQSCKYKLEIIFFLTRYLSSWQFHLCPNALLSIR